MAILFNFIIFFVVYFVVSYIFNKLAVKISKKEMFNKGIKVIFKNALTVSLVYLVVLIFAKFI